MATKQAGSSSVLPVFIAKYDTRSLPVKMLDAEWLELFQKGAVLLKPGDALRVQEEVETRYDFDEEVIATHHKIIRVLEVIPAPIYNQPELF